MRTQCILLIGIFLLFSSSIQAGDSCYDNFDKEQDFFLKAKEYVFKRDWEKATAKLKAYLETYPSGYFKDEALFWLAKSLDKLSTGKKSLGPLLEMKEEAIKNLDLLLNNHAESLWRDDAQASKKELSGQLALLGTEKHRRYLDEVAASQDVNEADLKRTALNSLKYLEPEIAVPLLKKIIKTEKNPVVRKESIILFSWEHPEKTLDIIHDVAETDPDASVRKEAAYLVEQVEMENLPVHLNYFSFGAKFKDSTFYNLLPENTPKILNIARSKSNSKKSVQKAIKRFFDDKLIDLKSVEMSIGSLRSRSPRSYTIEASRQSKIDEVLKNYLQEYSEQKTKTAIRNILTEAFKYLEYLDYGMGTTSFRRIHGFHIMPIGEGFTKEYDLIRGNVLFRDIDLDKEHKISYTLDDLHDKLFVIRKGDKVAMLVLQFESEENEVDKKIVYTTKFLNFNGCTIHTSRKSWSLDETMQTKGAKDFGQAKVEIPGEKGIWKLIGNIISDGKGRFIGRNAVLYNPNQKIVVKAAQIIVPVKSPEKFEVIGK